jgi:hypothetical protein
VAKSTDIGKVTIPRRPSLAGYASNLLWQFGARARHDRTLWSYVVRGGPEDERIRYPHGARRPARQYAPNGTARNAFLGRAGRLDRNSAAAASDRVLKSLLFGIRTTDPVTIIAAVLMMFATAALAGYFPAHRATKLDPMVALRYE